MGGSRAVANRPGEPASRGPVRPPPGGKMVAVDEGCDAGGAPSCESTAGIPDIISSSNKFLVAGDRPRSAWSSGEVLVGDGCSCMIPQNAPGDAANNVASGRRCSVVVVLHGRTSTLFLSGDGDVLSAPVVCRRNRGAPNRFGGPDTPDATFGGTFSLFAAGQEFVVHESAGDGVIVRG